MEFQLTIMIIGKICSGKSTLANDLSNWLQIPKCSFGRYLLKYATDKGLKTDRDSLQALGESLIQVDQRKFLDDVISFGGHSGGRIIFEGVRHRSILQGISSKSMNTLSIFLDVKESVRLERFINREKDIDKGRNAVEDFLRFSAHKVEEEVELLKSDCDFIITSNKSYKHFLELLGVTQHLPAP